MIDKIAVTDPRIPIITVGTAFTADVVKKSEGYITNAPGESHYLIMQKPEYWCMRGMVWISIFLVLVLLASGCIGGTGDQTVPPPPPDTGPDSAYTWSGRSIALAVSTDGISTSSPQAREWFFKGLAASTQYARYNESLDYFDQALMIDQNFSEAWYAKGVALHNMMRYDEAIQCYNRALAIDPGNAVVVSLKKAAEVDWERRNASAKGFQSV